MIFFASSGFRWLVPRRFTFCFLVLPNVARWRTPARRNFTAPLFFTWNRFFAPLFVFSLGMSSSLPCVVVLARERLPGAGRGRRGRRRRGLRGGRGRGGRGLGRS